MTAHEILLEAIATKDSKKFKEAVLAGANPNERDEQGKPYFWNFKTIEALEELCTAGHIDLTTSDSKGINLLRAELGAYNHQTNYLVFLIKHIPLSVLKEYWQEEGDGIQFKKNYLNLAVENGHFKVADALVDIGAADNNDIAKAKRAHLLEDAYYGEQSTDLNEEEAITHFFDRFETIKEVYEQVESANKAPHTQTTKSISEYLSSCFGRCY